EASEAEEHGIRVACAVGGVAAFAGGLVEARAEAFVGGKKPFKGFVAECEGMHLFVGQAVDGTFEVFVIFGLGGARSGEQYKKPDPKKFHGMTRRDGGGCVRDVSLKLKFPSYQVNS